MTERLYSWLDALVEAYERSRQSPATIVALAAFMVEQGVTLVLDESGAVVGVVHPEGDRVIRDDYEHP